MMRRLAVFVFAVFSAVSVAEALTVRDLIELTRAGVGDEVLLALIEVDGGVHAIDAQTLKSMKEAGVSDRVIAALVRSGRQRSEPVPPAIEEASPQQPQPQVVVIDHHEPAVREVVVPVPIYVPVAVTRARRAIVPSAHTLIESTYVPFQSGPPVQRPLVPKTDHVYWGFGGKLRPDAWKPDGYEPERQKPRRHREKE